MREKDLKRLSRADLLEMLIDQSMELQKTKKRLSAAEAKLNNRQIAIDESGSIAEAALKLNGMFEAAQASCEQYMENIRLLSGRQEAICRRHEEESERKAAARLAETERRCAAMEAETRAKCARLLEMAQKNPAALASEIPVKSKGAMPRRRRRT
ncbi:MAG: hypothetical protein IKK34_12340 [Clostridia bacterium]|nr:hypothetical protein [Clostridia bacterium]